MILSLNTHTTEYKKYSAIWVLNAVAWVSKQNNLHPCKIISVVMARNLQVLQSLKVVALVCLVFMYGYSAVSASAVE